MIKLRSVFQKSAYLSLFLISQGAFAEEVVRRGGDGIGAWGAALAIGLAAWGGAMAQGKTAAAALEGIGRNPAARDQIFIPMIIGLVLIESLVLYALVVALLRY